MCLRKFLQIRFLILKVFAFLGWLIILPILQFESQDNSRKTESCHNNWCFPKQLYLFLILFKIWLAWMVLMTSQLSILEPRWLGTIKIAAYCQVEDALSQNLHQCAIRICKLSNLCYSNLSGQVLLQTSKKSISNVW